MQSDHNERRDQIETLLHDPETALRSLSDLKRLLPRRLHLPEPVPNTNAQHLESLTLGQRIADSVAKHMGSWPFIIIQSILLIIWILLNILAFVHHWDPYPFILLNLALSFQAAYAAPIIMMSQNRQAEKDRLEAHNDYLINVRAENEVTAILRHLEYQDALILQVLARMEQHDMQGPSPSIALPHP